MSFIEFTGYVFVSIRNSFFTGNHKNDDISFFHSNLCLVLDLFHKWSINIINPSSINHTERTVKPFTSSIDTVPCHSFDIFYD